MRNMLPVWQCLLPPINRQWVGRTVTNLNQDFFHRSIRIMKCVIDTTPVFLVHETLELNSVIEETFCKTPHSVTKRWSKRNEAVATTAPWLCTAHTVQPSIVRCVSYIFVNINHTNLSSHPSFFHRFFSLFLGFLLHGIKGLGQAWSS